MSLPQLSTALKRQPSLEKLSQPNRPYTHFIYDFPVQFKKQFPTAAPMGVGLIATWDFHVNQKGRGLISLSRCMLIIYRQSEYPTGFRDQAGWLSALQARVSTTSARTQEKGFRWQPTQTSLWHYLQRQQARR